MSWSSSASRPLEVMVKAPGPCGFARPKPPSLAAIFIGMGGGSRFASAASLSLRSQSKSSAVKFESMPIIIRSEEHTSELQSLAYLVCRLLLEKKKKKQASTYHNSYATLCLRHSAP